MLDVNFDKNWKCIMYSSLNEILFEKEKCSSFRKGDEIFFYLKCFHKFEMIILVQYKHGRVGEKSCLKQSEFATNSIFSL